MDDLRFPVGRFQRPDSLTDPQRAEMIETVAAAPARLREAVSGLSEEQLQTPYRPDGWTVRQLVHHVADSHMNAYVRFKLGLTEDRPTIKPYEEARWAELEDTRLTPIETSLTLLELLHERWVNLLRSLNAGDFERTVNHPENGPMSLNALLAMYAWHSRHHVAHVTNLRERMGW
jgi:uncharacterized damage-inducible protein DinB